MDVCEWVCVKHHTHTLCTNPPGDRIPNAGLWSEVGALNPGHASCKSVPGGSLFYGYDAPKVYSSNTGFEQKEAALLYFVVDAMNQTYFVLVHDQPGNSDGGSVRLKLHSPDLANKGVNVLLRDDPKPFADSCDNANKDCYAYDDTKGQGNFLWFWVSKETWALHMHLALTLHSTSPTPSREPAARTEWCWAQCPHLASASTSSTPTSRVSPTLGSATLTQTP